MSAELGEQLEAERQQRGTSPVGEESEVADAHEAAWQQVEQEAAQELVDRQSQEPLLVGVRGVSPAEGDVALLKGDESAVGDSDAVGVAAEIAQRVFRSAEGWLGIDDPVVAEQGSEPCGEGSWFRKWREVAVERELAWWKAVFSPATNLPRKTRLSTLTGRKKLWRDGIQWVWSGARPPAAATQWTWG